VEKAPPKGRPVSFDQFACFRIDPDNPFFRRDGIDNADRIVRQKACEFGPHGTHLCRLNLCDRSVMVNVCYVIVNRDFLMVLIGIDIILEYGVKGLF
jgi:hypothetical protein